MIQQNIISDKVSRGKFKISNPMASPRVIRLIDELGEDYRAQIIHAWKFGLDECLSELEQMTVKSRKHEY